MRVEARSDVATALDVRGVSVELGKRPIVSDVGFDVPTGGWLCIIGPNGAGKTTLVHAIAGLLHHTGSVRMWGRPLEARGRRERARTVALRSEEHTSELQSPSVISYAVFCLKKKKR